MDASDFLKNYIRMCSDVGDCEQCPCSETNFCKAPPDLRSPEGAEEVVHIVEKWAASHPPKTRQIEFLKMFPNVLLNNKGQPIFCPRTLDTAYHPVDGCVLDVDLCQRCRDQFWFAEVE